MRSIDSSNSVASGWGVGQILTTFGLFSALIGSLAVFANDLYYLLNHGVNPSIALFILAFVLAFMPRPWGLAVVMALLPLTAGLPAFLGALLGLKLLAMPNPGLDLVAGLMLGYLMAASIGKWRGRNQDQLNQSIGLVDMPWPVGLVTFTIAVSAILAVARNLYLSATTTSIKGLLFNLVHFRPMDWRADYLPLGNWISYTLAAGLIFLVIATLKRIEISERNAWVFRPLMLGLTISALVGLTQAATGFGLPEAQLEFRKDIFGYAAMGLQPDLHAFAAHMLLGVVGLWGYFFVCKSRAEKYLVLGIFLLSFAGLVASKSRASLFIAIATLFIFALIYFYRHSKKYFLISIAIAIGLIILIVVGAKSVTGLGWVGDLLSQMQSRRLDSLSDLGGMMGSRFEIWSAVINMFSAYPLMGVGEGEFYRLSSNISFARSEFLQLNKGENAHNYFLQVLAENGLVGIAVFAIAFIAPYRACRNKQWLMPALIGLPALFLGNVFAHSFLVRENLLLGAAMLGLLYVFARDHFSKVVFAKGRYPSARYLLLLLLVVAVASEIYISFGKLPFKVGADCFVKDVRSYPDGWTSGAWEERLPSGIKSIELVTRANRPELEKELLVGRLEMLVWIPGRGKVPVNAQEYRWSTSSPMTLRVDLPDEYFNSPHVISTRLQLSSCYTPRNLGINTDGRRLGVQIEKVLWQ